MTASLSLVPPPPVLRFGAPASDAVPSEAPPRGTHVALWHRLRTEISVTGYDPAARAVEVVWLATGRPVRLSVRTGADLQRDAETLVGDLDSWGLALLGYDDEGNPRATARDLLRVLRDMVPPTSSTESSEPGVEEEREDAATRLCRAALFGTFTVRSPGGGTHQTTAADSRGKVHSAAGVALLERDGRAILYMNLQPAIGGPLRESEFGSRVHATPARLARILRDSPRLVSRRAGVKGTRGGRWWAADVTDLLAAPADEHGAAYVARDRVEAVRAALAGVAHVEEPAEEPEADPEEAPAARNVPSAPPAPSPVDGGAGGADGAAPSPSPYPVLFW